MGQLTQLGLRGCRASSSPASFAACERRPSPAFIFSGGGGGCRATTRIGGGRVGPAPKTRLLLCPVAQGLTGNVPDMPPHRVPVSPEIPLPCQPQVPPNRILAPATALRRAVGTAASSASKQPAGDPFHSAPPPGPDTSRYTGLPWKPPAQPTGYCRDAWGPPTADDNKRASTGRARARKANRPHRSGSGPGPGPRLSAGRKWEARLRSPGRRKG
ncbi:hypothetical protein Celaphus_00004954 [Cervus elaphus hippelaphus]|uniref:Uncharacterized protein n=1 Tax=Cervus elaphus hippelaphus TaxID=46360 RepID=A0A212DCD4_CEREH|nr:hypothetical protein Celaphus_00004954 [Cervus elaphus hippelaphus]